MAYTSPVAAAVGLFRKDQLKKLWLNDALNTQAGKTADLIGTYRDQNQKSLSNYDTALQNATGQIGQLSNEDVGTLGGEIGKMKGYDPSNEYQGLGNYLTGLVGKFAPQLADIGKARVNLANANVYGGKGGGTYGDNVLLNNISRNLAPVFSSALSQINPAFSLVSGQRTQNLANLINTINNRAAIPLRTAELSTLPIRLRNEILAGEIGNEGGLSNAVRNNLLGTQLDTNFAGKLSDAGNAVFNTAVDLGKTALSAYMGGGGLGALGGMGGGGGGANLPSAGPANGGFNLQPVPHSYFQGYSEAPPSWGGYFNTGDYRGGFEGTSPNNGIPYNGGGWSPPPAYGFEGTTPPVPNTFNQWSQYGFGGY